MELINVIYYNIQLLKASPVIIDYQKNKELHYLIIRVGRKILLKIRLPYIDASVKVPSDPSALIELCKFVAPMNAVKFTINAIPIIRTFLVIRHRSIGLKPVLSDRTFTNCPVVSVLSNDMIRFTFLPRF